MYITFHWILKPNSSSRCLQFYDPSDATASVLQQNLHGYNTDPVSVLRAISPSNTSGSGGHSASPQVRRKPCCTARRGVPAISYLTYSLWLQGMPTANNSNLNALSMALAAQAQLMGQGSTAAADACAQSPGSHTSPYLQVLPHPATF